MCYMGDDYDKGTDNLLLLLLAAAGVRCVCRQPTGWMDT
jgi:hypothetical protein